VLELALIAILLLLLVPVWIGTGFEAGGVDGFAGTVTIAPVNPANADGAKAIGRAGRVSIPPASC
jgi:hypothetical protein